MRATLALLALLLSSGCYTVSYQTRLPPGGPRHEEHAHYFVGGLFGQKTVYLNRLCPQGVARWHNQATFMDGFLSVLTFGIYTPRTIHVECAALPAPEPPPPHAPPPPAARTVPPAPAPGGTP